MPVTINLSAKLAKDWAADWPSNARNVRAREAFAADLCECERNCQDNGWLLVRSASRTTILAEYVSAGFKP